MADLKISQLPIATTPLAGTEVLPIVQSSATKQVSIANLTAGRSVSVADATLTTGNLVIGTSGKGIDFSATGETAGMTSELLADYEEGTWTPNITSETGTLVSVTNQTGQYIKIGGQVFLSFRFNIVDKGTGGGGIVISNQPYAKNSAYVTGSIINESTGVSGALYWSGTCWAYKYDGTTIINNNPYFGTVTYTV